MTIKTINRLFWWQLPQTLDIQVPIPSMPNINRDLSNVRLLCDVLCSVTIQKVDTPRLRSSGNHLVIRVNNLTSILHKLNNSTVFWHLWYTNNIVVDLELPKEGFRVRRIVREAHENFGLRPLLLMTPHFLYKESRLAQAATLTVEI